MQYEQVVIFAGIKPLLYAFLEDGPDGLIPAAGRNFTCFAVIAHNWRVNSVSCGKNNNMIITV